MLSNLGNLFIFASILVSLTLIYNSIKEVNLNNNLISRNILNLSLFQIITVILSFITLLLAFIFSDFSLINVYENSHTAKPLIYKISGVWGNHEGSLLLWILILSLFSFLFLNFNKSNNKKFVLLTVIIQNILSLGFLIFLLTNSNPFAELYPVPKEGLGLNPILQDPALAIHPPLLYLGFVGSSIYFSAALASLISAQQGNNFVKSVKYWVIFSWSFQTAGILVGSIWAYYELGWGGYWFWDPVENSSLMPWFLMTALLHSLLILERKKGLYLWVITLSILTFTMSVTGTFLVRSGILNSVHTFANDPSRGMYILIFLSLMIFSSLVIFYKFAPVEKRNFEFLSKEFFILINNWFMIFFLIVVLIGTIYPIALEVLSQKKISVGPPYFNVVLAPFLIPFLFFLSYGPQSKWSSSKLVGLKKNLIIFISSIILTILFFYFSKMENIILNLIIIFSIYLILQSLGDLYVSFSKKSLNSFNTSGLSRIISHLGFGLLILFISFNSIFSVEYDLNLKKGGNKNIDNFKIKLIGLEYSNENNYSKVVGTVQVTNQNKKTSEILDPEIRIYKSPETITYEASIKSKILSDTYVTMTNLEGSEFYNIKFQNKPFMNLIWFSVMLIIMGGLLKFFERKTK
tara:strand:+ start:9753 stop:11651 length:1899 start_codon:yes stop_codon:yes gene_type:complete